MNTIYDLEELVPVVKNQINEYLEYYRSNIDNLDDNIILEANALLFSVSNACDILRKGMKGEF